MNNLQTDGKAKMPPSQCYYDVLPKCLTYLIKLKIHFFIETTEKFYSPVNHPSVWFDLYYFHRYSDIQLLGYLYIMFHTYIFKSLGVSDPVNWNTKC